MWRSGSTHLTRVILSGGGVFAAEVEGPLFANRDLRMQEERHYCVYMLASYSGTLYIGVTRNLRRRVWQHKQHLIQGFTADHGVERLLYFEIYREVLDAIAREKQLKGWTRAQEG